MADTRTACKMLGSLEGRDDFEMWGGIILKCILRKYYVIMWIALM
jgi:hypothetical protein